MATLSVDLLMPVYMRITCSIYKNLNKDLHKERKIIQSLITSIRGVLDEKKK